MASSVHLDGDDEVGWQGRDETGAHGRGLEPGRRTAAGRRQEDLAAGFLEACGMQIIDRNVRLGPDEIDIIARDGDEVVFVEVRSRRAGGPISPEGSVDRGKRSRLLRAAARWLDSSAGEPATCRFDVVAVRVDASGTARLRHWPSAFVLR